MLFATACVLELQAPSAWTQGLYYTTQVALIGSLADWFAVAALFTRPLGIRWHTALIPRQREAVIAGIRSWMEERLLNLSLWEELAAAADVTRRLRAWRQDETHRRTVRSYVRKAAVSAAKRVPTETLAATLATVVRREAASYLTLPRVAALWAARQGAMRTVGALGAAVERRSQTESAVRLVAALLAAAVREETAAGWAHWGRRLAEWTGWLSYDDAARSVLAAVQAQAAAWRDGTSPTATAAAATLADKVAELAADAVWQARWTQWLERVLAVCPLERWLEEEIAARLADVEPIATAVSQSVEEKIDAWLGDDARMAATESRIREGIVRYGMQYRQQLGELVAEVLSAYDEARLNRFIFTKTEDELAAIRMNGAVVGALIGAGIWALLYGVYAPIVAGGGILA